MGQTSPRRGSGLTDLLKGYSPPEGTADEMLYPDGTIRPVWRPFIEHFAGLSKARLSEKFARGDQYLRDAGVFFRQYGEGESTERTWPLSHIPVLIDGAEWRQISEGLIQRADLLEALCADLYGPNNLVRDGHLPASLIAGSDEWLRPMVGITPRSNRFLHFIAFELGRGPDGTWWVLGDRTQAPSGAGFALENRVATARVFTDFYKKSNVVRLAEFFRGFRRHLLDLSGGEYDRATILTPGPLNDTYFEHTYIARYLGLNLLEGEDLIVQNGQVMVRTVEGPQPINVIWRRLDAAFADPLELDEHSQLGTPGLVNAIRRGNLTSINALGAGILEMRALQAFMPKISNALRGEALKLPNVATWWCGQPTELSYVLENAERMMICPARSVALPFEPERDAAIAGHFVEGPERSLRDWIAEQGGSLVGQEAVRLSTSPAVVDGRLVARPMSLRVFLARVGDSWQVMPGGFARIGRTEDPTAVNMQHGGSVADVWIVDDRPVMKESIIDGINQPYHQAVSDLLPSRAADNLFWLGRYIERAEHVIRLLRAYHIRLSEASGTNTALLTHFDALLETYGANPSAGYPIGLKDILSGSLSAASKVRDRFSLDGWAALNDVAGSDWQGIDAGDDMAWQMAILLRKLNGFSGLVHENMYRGPGWRFLAIGRSLERAATRLKMLAWLAAKDAPEGMLDIAVEVGDSVMTHRRRFSVATSRESVMDLLALDEMNPRAVLCQLAEIKEDIEFLPGAFVDARRSILAKHILKTHTALSVEDAQTFDSARAQRFTAAVLELSNLLTRQYFS